MTKKKRCDKFGYGYNPEHEQCQACESASECHSETHTYNLKIQLGQKPNIPLAPIDPKRMPVHVRFNRSSTGDFQISIHVKWEFLKNRFGLRDRRDTP
jgi:hypothetical protein